MIRGMCFTYAIIPPKQRPEPTDFQLFDRRWPAAHELIFSVLQFPACVPDMRGGVSNRVRLRSLGFARHSLVLLDPEELPTLPAVPCLVLVTAPETDDLGRDYVRNHSEPVLHLPSNALDNETARDDADWTVFDCWLQRVTEHVALVEPKNAPFFREFLVGALDNPGHPSAPIWNHRFTWPNDLALSAVRYPRHWADRPIDETACAGVDDALEESYKAVKSIRDEHFRRSEYPPGSTELIVTSAATLRTLPAVIPNDLGASPAQRFVYRTLVKNRALSLPAALNPDTMRRLGDADADTMLHRRHWELNSQSMAVAVEACSQFAPTVPVIAGFGCAEGALSRLDENLRSRRPDWRRRVSEDAVEVGRRMLSCLPEFLQNELPSIRGTIKAFSDDPVELIAAKSTPLMLQNPVVRVPVSPAIVLSRLHTLADPLILHPSDFRTVLILRGTLPNDRVHGLIESFARAVLGQASAIQVRVEDVRSAADITAVLRDFRGAFAVVDAHGIHQPRKPGYVALGDELVNFARHRARFPPVVFLAVCDTHCIARHADTLAASILGSGARTVIGTLSEVDALESALMCGQLLHRVMQLAGLPGPIRWSEFFALTMRSAHVRQVAQLLSSQRLISLPEDSIGAALQPVENAISSFDTNWRQIAVDSFAAHSGESTELIDELWRRHAYLTESCLYCQLGHADAVFLAPTDAWGYAVPTRPSSDSANRWRRRTSGRGARRTANSVP